MIPFLIGAAELDALAAGQPSVVAALGMVGLASLPLAVLQTSKGVLRRIGAPDGPALPLPPGLRPLAILAPDAEAAAGLVAGLPAGIPLLVGTEPLPALLACLADALAFSKATRRGALDHPSSLPPLPTACVPAATSFPDLAAEMAPTGADFQDLKLYQHSVSADGSYRHIDLGLIGLAAASGVWREARLKLFDRRGTIGLEFRNMRGWPKVFDAWPDGGSDRFGPFWRLEAHGVPKAVAELGSSHNRAIVAALLEVLPIAARRAAALADLPEEEQEAWAARGRSLMAAVATAVASGAAGEGSPARS